MTELNLIPTVFIGLFGLIFVGVTGGLAVFNYLRLKKFASVEMTRVADVEEPLGKVQGKVVADEDNLMKAPFSNVECVGYYLAVEQLQIRMVTETIGNRRVTRPREEWVQVFHQVDAVEFAIRDKSGSADVDLEGVGSLDITDSEHVEKGQLSYGGKAWRRLEREFDEFRRFGSGNYRATEQLILPGDKLLVFGSVSLKGDNPLFRINKKKGQKELTLTDRSEKQVTARYKRFALGFAIASAVLCLLFVGIAVAVNLLMMKK